MRWPGRVDEALRLLEEETARLARMQATGGLPPRRPGEGLPKRTCWPAGDEKPNSSLRPTLVQMRATRRHTGEADCLWMLGEVEARRDHPDLALAETHFRDALALAEEHEIRPRQAHCHLALGKLLRRLGRLDEARAELTTATGMLREMGMTRWLPEAEAELNAAS